MKAHTFLLFLAISVGGEKWARFEPVPSRLVPVWYEVAHFWHDLDQVRRPIWYIGLEILRGGASAGHIHKHRFIYMDEHL